MNTLAQINNPYLNTSIRGLDGGTFVSRLLSLFVTLGFTIGVIFFVFMLVMGGVGWISSGGDKSAVETARSRITYALIGLLVLFATFAVIRAVEFMFGINILNIDIAKFAITAQ